MRERFDNVVGRWDDSRLSTAAAGTEIAVSRKGRDPMVTRGLWCLATLATGLMLLAATHGAAQNQEAPANRPPTLTRTFADMDLYPGALQDTGPLSDFFRDPDGDQIAWEASSDRPAVAYIDGPISKRYGVHVGAGDTEGIARITVTATDPSGLTVSDVFLANNRRRASPTYIKLLSDMAFTIGDPPRSILLSHHFSGADHYRIAYSPAGHVMSVVLDGDLLTITSVSSGAGKVDVFAFNAAEDYSVRDSFEVTVSGGPPTVIAHEAWSITLESPSAEAHRYYLSSSITGAEEYEVTASPTGIVQASVGGGWLTVKPVSSGEAVLTIRGRNQYGLSDPRYLRAKVLD